MIQHDVMNPEIDVQNLYSEIVKQLEELAEIFEAERRFISHHTVRNKRFERQRTERNSGN